MKNKKEKYFGEILILIGIIGIVLSILLSKELNKYITLAEIIIVFVMGFVIGNKYKNWIK